MKCNILAGSLLAAAFCYALIVAVGLWFTIGFFGFDGFRCQPVAGVIFLVVATSPLPVCSYFVTRARVWLRGERPPF